MSETRFWLIRHALVEENARAILYGIMDVPLCETTLLEQAPMYRALADTAAPPRDLDGHAPVAHAPHRRGDLRRRLSPRRARGRTGPDRAEPRRVARPAACRIAGAADPAEARLLAAGRPRTPTGRRDDGRRHPPGRRGAGAARRPRTPARTWSSSAMAARSAPRWRIACASDRTTPCIWRCRTSR